MKYAAIHTYAKNPESLIATHRPAHRAYLSGLIEKGQLVVAGPYLDDSGALIKRSRIAGGGDAIIKADLFFAAGVFQTWQLTLWKTVFGNPGLLPPNG